jgi:AraC-like DNA-binding protein
LSACYQGGPYSQLTAKASLEMLLVTLCELFDPQIVKVLPEQDEQHQEIVSRIITYLEQNYASKITLEDLAQFSQYNRTYLSTMFKNSVGINFYEYLTRLRFQHALFDLASSEKNLTEIAIDNGFADLKSFNLRFRETLHYTPSEYRSLVYHDNAAAEFHERRLIHPNSPIVQTKLNEYMQLLD